MFANPPNRVAADYLERATDGFSEGRQLGAGSFGIVYRGEADGLEFAVKRLDDVTSAERELAVLARFQHPHIIRLLGFTPAGTTPRCLVYELAERGSLEHIFREEDESPSAWHPLTWKTRVRIGVGVSTALNFLHRSQAAPVFHRDVKAANICLMSDFTPKLIDCGVSMLIDEARAQTGVTSYSATGNLAIGTAEYMCGRYARSKKYGEKAEVYSFGIVLMELLTGRVNHAGDLLFDVFIEDAEEDLAEARDRRAGDWPANVVATIAQLARQSLGTGADYTRRPTMMAVMRELRRLEAAHCQRTADEVQLAAELERVRAQLARLQTEAASAAPAVTLHTCIVCFDEEVPADRGVACRGPDAHFTCDGCLERIVIDTATQVQETNELVAQAAAAEAGGDRRRAWFLAGRVCCPSRMPDCPSDPYTDGAVARHVSEGAFAAHMHAGTLLPIAREAQQVFERAQETMRAEVEHIRAQVRAGLEVEQGRALLAAQLQQQMPNARQCRQCGFGPIDHMACADLQAHHGQRFGNARINNACPQCGWFSRNIREWPAWDGQLPQEAIAGLAEAGVHLLSLLDGPSPPSAGGGLMGGSNGAVMPPAPLPLGGAVSAASAGIVAASPPAPATAVQIGGDPFLRVLMEVAAPLAADATEIKLYLEPTTGALRNLTLQLEPPPTVRATLRAPPPAAVAGARVTIPMLSPGGASVVSAHVACAATPGGPETVLLGQMTYSDVASVTEPRVISFRLPISLPALLRPRPLTTPEFGQNWPVHAAESKTQLPCAAASDPSQFMALLQRGLNLAPVQIIGFECIACGMVVGSADTMLVHAKLSRTAAGPSVELTLRTKDRRLTDGLQRAAHDLLGRPAGHAHAP